MVQGSAFKVFSDLFLEPFINRKVVASEDEIEKANKVFKFEGNPNDEVDQSNEEDEPSLKRKRVNQPQPKV